MILKFILLLRNNLNRTFKFAHSRKGVNGTSPIQRTYNCVAGINASLNSTVLDLKLSRYNIFNGQTYVGKIIPTTFNDMEINGLHREFG